MRTCSRREQYNQVWHCRLPRREGWCALDLEIRSCHLLCKQPHVAGEKEMHSLGLVLKNAHVCFSVCIWCSSPQVSLKGDILGGKTELEVLEYKERCYADEFEVAETKRKQRDH